MLLPLSNSWQSSSVVDIKDMVPGSLYPEQDINVKHSASNTDYHARCNSKVQETQCNEQYNKCQFQHDPDKTQT